MGNVNKVKVKSETILSHGQCGQLVDGLKILGVAEAIEKDPDVLKPLFFGGPIALEVQDLLDLFSPCFSPHGNNRKRQEN